MPDSYVDWPEIKINGIALNPSSGGEGYMEEAVVDDDLQLPASFAITVRGPDVRPYRIGDRVEIDAHGLHSQGPILSGEITTITGDYDHGGQRIHLRGYDVSHRLHRGSQTRTFVNVTDSDMSAYRPGRRNRDGHDRFRQTRPTTTCRRPI